MATHFQEGMENIRDGKYLGKYKIIFSLLVSFKLSSFKEIIIKFSCGVYIVCRCRCNVYANCSTDNGKRYDIVKRLKN